MIPLSGLLPETSAAAAAAARFRISLAKTHNYISWSVFLTLSLSLPPVLPSSLLPFLCQLHLPCTADPHASI